MNFGFYETTRFTITRIKVGPRKKLTLTIENVEQVKKYVYKMNN